MKEELMKTNPHPQVWEGLEHRYPNSELTYFRADHDGYRWWNTLWPVNRGLETKELTTEFDGVYNDFIKEFPTLDALRRFCQINAQPTGDPTEFNLYLERKHGFYWLRVITRKGDYNLYLHCLSKAAMTE